MGNVGALNQNKYGSGQALPRRASGSGSTPLVFKGGTCLSKVYTNFYRLSEDLDFMIPMPCDSTRADRRAAIKPAQRLLPGIEESFPALRLVSPLKGHNQSAQYIAELEYTSAISGTDEHIRLEIGLREPLLGPPRDLPARTLLVSGLTRKPVIGPFGVIAMDIQEAYAEKCRAALTRREPAIRDLFDIDYGTKRLGIDLFDSEFIAMVAEKLAVPDNEDIGISQERKELLSRQLDTELRPVLRQSDFETFDLETAFEIINKLADRLK